MTIENLKNFFSQIGYNWTGTICDVTNYFAPFRREDYNYAPKTFEEILQYEHECQPVPYFVFIGEDERGNYEYDYCFSVTPERFVSYYYDIDDDPYGSSSTLLQNTDYTKQWLEFQQTLQNGNKL